MNKITQNVCVRLRFNIMHFHESLYLMNIRKVFTTDLMGYALCRPLTVAHCLSTRFLALSGTEIVFWYPNLSFGTPVTGFEKLANFFETLKFLK